MKGLTYLDRMQLLDDIDVFYNYFFELHNMCSESEDFDRDKFNKNLAILLTMMQDIKY